MNKTQKAIELLNNVQNDLYNLDFSQNFLDKVHEDFIIMIKQNVFDAANIIDTVQYSATQFKTLEDVVEKCISSMHSIFKNDLVNRAEDIYADLSANIYLIHEQVERIKNL